VIIQLGELIVCTRLVSCVCVLVGFLIGVIKPIKGMVVGPHRLSGRIYKHHQVAMYAV